MPLSFPSYQPNDEAKLKSMIFGLYAEDPEGELITEDKILKTIHHLSQSPASGSILMIRKAGQAIGYAILINYWSNEYGGWILQLDEFFILPSFRRQGVGRQFLSHLKRAYKDQFQAICIAIMPSNHQAKRFYLREGFEEEQAMGLRFLL